MGTEGSPLSKENGKSGNEIWGLVACSEFDGKV